MSPFYRLLVFLSRVVTENAFLPDEAPNLLEIFFCLWTTTFLAKKT